MMKAMASTPNTKITISMRSKPRVGDGSRFGMACSGYRRAHEIWSCNPYRVGACCRWAKVRQRTDQDQGARVYLVRSARTGLAKLSPIRRAALLAGFQRVGSELLNSASQVEVETGWKRRTWPRRRYPQQCYARSTKYMLQHLEIEGARLVHGMIAHAPYFVPMAHAWVELPGAVVFDGVVQAFFSRASYYAVMGAQPVVTYTGPETQRLADSSGYSGPWELLASVNVGTKR
jgi:hypothetical protein